MRLYSPETEPLVLPPGPDPVLPRQDAHRPPRHGGGSLPPRQPNSHRKPPSRRTRRAAALIALVLAGGAAAVGFLESGGGHPAVTGSAAANAKAVAAVPRPGIADGAASALPVPVGQPVRALVPTPTPAARTRKAVRPSSSPTPSGHASSAPPVASAPSAAPSSAPPSPSPAPASPRPSPTPPASGGSTCTKPSFTTTAPFGSENLGAYTVTNDMWNIGGGGISQSLSVCSASNWFVNATVADDGGGVKTFPDSYYMFGHEPAISSLHTVTSSFAQSSPGSGTFEDAYDIWLNGTVSDGNHDEVMIWTENHGQIPGGSPMATATFDGESYTVWRGTNNLVSFVAHSTLTSGTLNLLPFFQWLISNGWEPAGSTLVQVDYGVEIVSTNSAPETFSFSDFSVSSS